jgi:hypothetical protein
VITNGFEVIFDTGVQEDVTVGDWDEGDWTWNASNGASSDLYLDFEPGAPSSGNVLEWLDGSAGFSPIKKFTADAGHTIIVTGGPAGSQKLSNKSPHRARWETRPEPDLR